MSIENPLKFPGQTWREKGLKSEWIRIQFRALCSSPLCANMFQVSVCWKFITLRSLFAGNIGLQGSRSVQYRFLLGGLKRLSFCSMFFYFQGLVGPVVDPSKKGKWSPGFEPPDHQSRTLDCSTEQCDL